MQQTIASLRIASRAAQDELRQLNLEGQISNAEWDAWRNAYEAVVKAIDADEFDLARRLDAAIAAAVAG